MRCSCEQTLTDLGRRIAREVGDGVTDAKLDRYQEFIHSLADKNRERRAEPVRRGGWLRSLTGRILQRRGMPIWAFSSALVVLTLGAALLLAWPRFEEIPVMIEPSTEGIGNSVIAANSEVSLAFGNGSRFDLRQGGSATVESATQRSVDVHLENGVLMARVKGNGTTEWSVQAGPYRVVVLGTRFGVSWDEKAGVFDVKVEKGTVRVEGTRLNNDAVLLTRGYHLRVDAEKRETIIPGPNEDALLTSFPELVAEKRPRLAERFSPPRGPENAVQWSGDAETEAGGGAHPGPRSDRKNRRKGAPRPVPGQPEPSSEAAKTGAAATLPLPPEEDESGNEGKDEAAPILPQLIQLIKDGRYAEARLMVYKIEDAPLVKSDLVALWSLKDVARTAGLHDIAERTLLTIRRRFGRTKQARLAAYCIGKIYEENLDNAATAIRWYATYLTESPHGNMAEQARAGKMRGLDRQGRAREARHEARVYLDLYRDGTYEHEAKAVLSE